MELERMEVAGNIEKVESSEWASPIVVAVKPGRENVRIPLSETSKDITTIHTQFGRFRFNRLPYGIKISPVVF